MPLAFTQEDFLVFTCMQLDWSRDLRPENPEFAIVVVVT